MRSGYDESVDASSTGEIDVAGVGRALWRKRWWVVGPTLAALAAAGIFVNVVKPRYTADGRLLLENQENYLTRTEKGEKPESITAPDAEAVQSQIQLLTSRDLARRVIKSVGLPGNPEFDPVAKGIDPVSRLLILIGAMREPTSLPPEDRILENFFERFSVLSPTKTRVLSVEFSSRDPDLAARAANAVMDAYIEIQRDAKRDNARAAARSLATLVADLQNKVAEAEARVEAFRSKSGLLIGANNAIISTQHLGDLNTQLSSSRAAQADAQAKARVLRDMLRQGRIGEIPDVANNELIRRISEQRVVVRAQLALESRTLLPAHPRIKELTAQIADLDREWRAAAERTVRTLENDARIAGSRVENLQRALEEQKRVAGAAGAEEVRLRDLERAARLLKDQLEAETAKYQEARARESMKATPADARVIHRALAPQIPSFPKKIPITALSTLAALVFSVGWIVAGEVLSGRVRVARPVFQPAFEGRAGEPAPAAADAGPPVAPESAPAAATVQPAVLPDRQAGDRIAQTPGARGADTGRMTSKPQEKSSACVKTLVAICDGGEAVDGALAIARGLSQRGRALLVDADAGRADLEKFVRPPGGASKGLAELMAGAAEFGEVIYRDGDSRLHLVPGGREGGGERYDFALVAQALAGAYDFVVFATRSPQKAHALAPLFDMTLVEGGSGAAALRDELRAAGLNASLVEGTGAALDAA